MSRRSRLLPGALARHDAVTAECGEPVTIDLIDLDPLAAAELGVARSGAARSDPTLRVRRGDGVGPLPVDRMRSVLDDLRHLRRHAVLAAGKASRAGVDDVANYHLPGPAPCSIRSTGWSTP